MQRTSQCPGGETASGTKRFAERGLRIGVQRASPAALHHHVTLTSQPVSGFPALNPQAPEGSDKGADSLIGVGRSPCWDLQELRESQPASREAATGLPGLTSLGGRPRACHPCQRQQSPRGPTDTPTPRLLEREEGRWQRWACLSTPPLVRGHRHFLSLFEVLHPLGSWPRPLRFKRRKSFLGTSASCVPLIPPTRPAFPPG